MFMVARCLFSRKDFLVSGLLVLGVLAAVPGCGQSEKLYPVSGKVSVGNGPLTMGMISLVPDAGNPTKAHPSASIGSDGSYTVTTDGKTGAPAGKYKVAVTTMVPPGADTSVTPVPINQKYNNADTSGLHYEVVEKPEPGRYDLKVTK
jgi:hypothetical protein